MLLTAAIIFFAAQNLDSVDVTVLFWHFRVPLALIALVPLLAGLLVGVGGTAVLFARRRRAAQPEPEAEPASEEAEQPAEAETEEDTLGAEEAPSES
jgi:hypothetical protein